MLQRLRHHLGLGRRSRRSLSAIAWLCFLVAAMPCMTAWAACCPPTPEPGEGVHAQHAAHTHGDSGAIQGHSHDLAKNPGDESGQPDHDCAASAGNCCDEVLPTLEDRSPKPLPSPVEAGLVASTDPVTEGKAHFRPSPEHATGPPGHLRPHPRTHLEHCSFLI